MFKFCCSPQKQANSKHKDILQEIDPVIEEFQSTVDNDTFLSAEENDDVVEQQETTTTTTTTQVLQSDDSKPMQSITVTTNSNDNASEASDDSHDTASALTPTPISPQDLPVSFWSMPLTKHLGAVNEDESETERR